MMLFRNTKIRFFISSIVAVAVLYFLWSWILKEDLSLLSFNFDVRWGLAALALNFLPLLAKTFRFSFFWKEKIARSALLNTVSIHSFWNYLLPFRAGELSYVYLIKKSGGVSTAETLTSLIVARVFDAAVVMLFLGLASLLLFTNGVMASLLGQMVWGLVFIAVVGVLLLGRRQEIVGAFLDRRIQKIQYTGAAFLLKALHRLREVVAALGRFGDTRSVSLFFLLSLAVWVSDFLFVWVALRAAGLSLSPQEALFIAAFPVIAALLPLQTPVGLGTFEGTMLAGFAFLGVGGPQAVAASILFHAELVFFALLYALGVYWRHSYFKDVESIRTHTEFYEALADPQADFRNLNLAELVLSYAKGSRLLDVGCGYGLLLHKAHSRGFEAEGIEPEERVRGLAFKTFGALNIYPAAIESFRPPLLFDTITAVDVLECIEKDRDALRHITSFVKEGGRLIVAVPAHQWLFGARDRMLGYFRRYSKGELEQEFQGLGFKILASRRWNMLGFLPYFLMFKVLGIESHFAGMRGGNAKGLGGRLTSSLLNFWFRRVERLLNLGFGLTLIIVAEKTDNDILI